MFSFVVVVVVVVVYQFSGQQKKPRSDDLTQVNFVLKILKIEVQLPGERVKSVYLQFSNLPSLNRNISLINDNFQSKATSKFKTTTLVNH